MYLREISPSTPDVSFFERVNAEAFPPQERMSLAEMFDFTAACNAELLGIYEDERPLGFTLILKNAACAFIILLVLDISVRSKGYGSKTLRELQRRYAKLQLVVDFEAPDAQADNNAWRLRRRSFYLRSGFIKTGRFTVLHGERFEVLCSGGALREQALLDLIHIIHEFQSGLDDALYY